MLDQDAIAWAVMLSPEILFDRYTHQWEANAISKALWDQQQITSEVVPLAPLNCLLLTDAEREAIKAAIAYLQPVENYDNRVQNTLCALLERTQ